LNPDWRNRYEVAIAAARQAGQHALRYFDNNVTVESKADASPVTIADRESEDLLRKLLSAAFPHDGFLGEEYGETPGTSGYRWILDPIDGTRSFIRGVPLWATLVGLEYKDEQIAGIAEAPALGQSWRALRGDGAYRGDRRIHVTSCDKLADSVVYYSGLKWFKKAGVREHFGDLCDVTPIQRGFGDFYGFVLVAQGSGELMVEHGVHAWDVAALKPIIEEAGGRFSNWDGGVDIFKPDVVCSNGRVHDAALAALTKRPLM
jgi:histidinol-phosphatase